MIAGSVDGDVNPTPAPLELQSPLAAFRKHDGGDESGLVDTPGPTKPKAKEAFRVSSFRITKGDGNVAVSTPVRRQDTAEEDPTGRDRGEGKRDAADGPADGTLLDSDVDLLASDVEPDSVSQAAARRAASRKSKSRRDQKTTHDGDDYDDGYPPMYTYDPSAWYVASGGGGGSIPGYSPYAGAPMTPQYVIPTPYGYQLCAAPGYPAPYPVAGHPYSSYQPMYSEDYAYDEMGYPYEPADDVEVYDDDGDGSDYWGSRGVSRESASRRASLRPSAALSSIPDTKSSYLRRQTLSGAAPRTSTFGTARTGRLQSGGGGGDVDLAVHTATTGPARSVRPPEPSRSGRVPLVATQGTMSPLYTAPAVHSTPGRSSGGGGGRAGGRTMPKTTTTTSSASASARLRSKSPRAANPPVLYSANVASTSRRRTATTSTCNDTPAVAASVSCFDDEAALHRPLDLTSGLSAVDALPGEDDRLRAAVERLDAAALCPITAMDVHDAVLALVRGVALRDAYSTLRDVLSDVPLAVMCMPKPNNTAMQHTITSINTLRQRFEEQIEVAVVGYAKQQSNTTTAAALPEGNIDAPAAVDDTDAVSRVSQLSAAFESLKLSGGAAAVLPKPSDARSGVSGGGGSGTGTGTATDSCARSPSLGDDPSATTSRESPSLSAHTSVSRNGINAHASKAQQQALGEAPGATATPAALQEAPASYMFPSGRPPVAYYGDDDFAEAKGVAFRREGGGGGEGIEGAIAAGMSEEAIQAHIDTFSPEVRNNFACLRAVWEEKLRKEEELGRDVLAERGLLLRQMWQSAQGITAKVLPLAADTRSTYAGQMKRLEQLSLQEKDAEWNVPDSRSDLRWHAMVRLYNAFCRHVALPRFKLSASLPRQLGLYLRALVKGSTEEEREGLDNLDDWLAEGSEPCETYVSGGVNWDRIADAAMRGKGLHDLGLTEDGEPNTHSRKLGQLLRDPGAWWAGFENQWRQNQVTLARRWWRKCERGQPANEEELLQRFKNVGLKWRKGKSGPSWRDVSTGSGSQWGGGSWGECVSWVHQHLYDSAKAANTQWREFSARRLVFRGLNEQVRLDVYNVMLYVGASLQSQEAAMMTSHVAHADSRELLFRDEIERLSDQEATLARMLEEEGAANPAVLTCLHTLARRIPATQLCTHRTLLTLHVSELCDMLKDVFAVAEECAQQCAADRVYEEVAGGPAGAWYQAHALR